jgi:hypothetical protein
MASGTPFDGNVTETDAKLEGMALTGAGVLLCYDPNPGVVPALLVLRAADLGAHRVGAEVTRLELR